jgi:drug/metabolite transporter (DMT)-like permease
VIPSRGWRAGVATTSEDPLRAVQLMTLFALAWVYLEEVVASTLTHPYPILQVVWIRYGVHLVLMLLFNLQAPQLMWRTQRLGFQLGRSLLMLVMPASYALAVAAGIPDGSIWALFWISPLMALFGARVVLGDDVPRRTWAICLSCAVVAGTILIDRDTPVGPSVLSPVLMAAAFAGYVVMTRGLVQERLQTNLFYSAFGVFVALSPIVPWSWVTPNGNDFAELASIGIVGLVALCAFDRAVVAAPVSRSIAALYVHVPAFVLATWAVAGDRPSLRHVIGAALIGAVVIGVAWTSWRQTQRVRVEVAA